MLQNVKQSSRNLNGVNFDFEVKLFDLEGQGQSLPKTIGILTNVFSTYDPNLVVLAWTGDDLSRGQTWWRTDWRTDAGNDNTRRPILASGKIIEICYLGTNWQHVSIGSDNGLAQFRPQAIVWTNADLIHYRIYTALWSDELINKPANQFEDKASVWHIDQHPSFLLKSSYISVSKSSRCDPTSNHPLGLICVGLKV